MSIVIPCYNAAPFLEETIRSVLEQTYTPTEVIVVDDGSMDGSTDIARRFPVRLVQQDRRGTSVARNRGIAESRGEYVLFHDADDRLLPHAAETGVAALESHPECGLVYGLARLLKGDVLLPQNARRVEGACYAQFLRGDVFAPAGAAMHRRTAVEAVGGFREGMVNAQDYDFYLRVARRFPVFCHNREVVDYRLHTESASGRSHRARLVRGILRALENQREPIGGDPELLKAMAQGKRYWLRHHAPGICVEAYWHASRAAIPSALRALGTLARHYPLGLGHLVLEPWSRLVARLRRTPPAGPSNAPAA